MVAIPDDPRIDRLLAHWNDLRDSGRSPSATELTDDPGLQAALARAIAEIEAAEDGLGLGPSGPARAAAGVAGRYEILAGLTRGGMGEVYRARDLEIEGREVAYKVMRAEGEPSPADVARFYREVRLTDKVRQPGVVPIYGRFDDASGRPAYAMEFVDGETLGAVRKRLGGAQPPDDAERYVQVLRRFLDACRIVGVAHDKGVVHGDLNSGNILLIEKRQATRVVDWGSAVEVGADGPGRSHPVAPDYRDPALAAGEPPTPASDIYALGVGLGKLAESFETGGVVVLGNRKPASALRSLRAIAQKAAAVMPDERYSNMEDFSADLERFLADQRVEADRNEPLSERAWRWASHHRAAVTAALAVATVGGSSLVGIGYLAQEARQARRVSLASQYGEIAAVCKMLYGQDSLDTRGDDLDHIRVLRQIVEGRDRDSAHLAQLMRTLGDGFAQRNATRVGQAKERQAEIERRMTAGFRILNALIEEYPEREGTYRMLLARGYLDLGTLKLGTALTGQELTSIVREALAGRAVERAGRADIESALALSAKALSVLPPLGRDAPAGDPVREEHKTANLGRTVCLLSLNRATEALQAFDGYLAVCNEAVCPMVEMRPSFVMTAEVEQQRLPWSRPPAADHAKAVAMADYLASQRGVSDAAVFNAACACSLASVDPAADATEREGRAARAVGYLRRIADKGYFHGLRTYPPPTTDTIKELKTDEALDPLRDRPDFRALVDRLMGGNGSGGG